MSGILYCSRIKLMADKVSSALSCVVRKRRGFCPTCVQTRERWWRPSPVLYPRWWYNSCTCCTSRWLGQNLHWKSRSDSKKGVRMVQRYIFKSCTLLLLRHANWGEDVFVYQKLRPTCPRGYKVTLFFSEISLSMTSNVRTRSPIAEENICVNTLLVRTASKAEQNQTSNHHILLSLPLRCNRAHSFR